MAFKGRTLAIGLFEVSGAGFLASCESRPPPAVETPIVPVATVGPATDPVRPGRTIFEVHQRAMELLFPLGEYGEDWWQHVLEFRNPQWRADASVSACHIHASLAALHQTLRAACHRSTSSME